MAIPGKAISGMLHFLNRPPVIGTVSAASLAGITTAAVVLTPVLSDYCNACTSEISGFSGNLTACRQPYGSRITAYETILGASCGVLGYILQKLLERTDENPPESSKIIDKLKMAVSHVQTNYSYELSLGLEYLYNEGFWIDPSNPKAWLVYFQCQAAAIGVASAFLGMYARIQWVVLRTNLSGNGNNSAVLIPFSLKNRCKVIAYSSITTVMTAMVFIPGPTEHAQHILKELSLILLAKPIGRIFITLLRRRENLVQNSQHKKYLSFLGTVTRIMPSLLVPLAYYIYFTSSSDRAGLSGLVIVGFATGVKDVYYRPPEQIEQKNPAPIQRAPCPQVACKVWRFTKEYWRTGAVITFAVTAAQLRYLNCYNLAEYICPFSFQLSNNYINIDGDGVNMAIEAGLAQYYVRKLFKHLSGKITGRTGQAMQAYMHFTDKYQFDLLSLIPLAIAESGVYTPNYNAYATYNPPAVLVLLGVTFGTYKEKVNSQTTDAYRPIFTDTSAVTNTLAPLV